MEESGRLLACHAAAHDPVAAAGDDPEHASPAAPMDPGARAAPLSGTMRKNLVLCLAGLAACAAAAFTLQRRLAPQQPPATSPKVAQTAKLGAAQSFYGMPSVSMPAVPQVAIPQVTVPQPFGAQQGQLPAAGTQQQQFPAAGAAAPPPPAAQSQQVAPAPAAATTGAVSLYCVEMTCPFGGELELVKNQFSKHKSIFLCEGHDVFSNESIEIGPGYMSQATGGTMVVEHGGKWGTVMNTDVFVRFWQAVGRVGTYNNHDWTVKADPDAMFMPQRLRDLVTCGPECNLPGGTLPVPGGPVFFNNCKWGMHGGMEVMSLEGIQLFITGMGQCESIRLAAMDINQPPGQRARDHAFGEDQYLRRCLRHVGVHQVEEEPILLSELRACGQPYPTDCKGVRVAFHAMKTVEDWNYCAYYAENFGTWPVHAA